MERRFRDRRGRLRPGGRVCDHKDCATVLCYLNVTPRCFVHGGWTEAAHLGERREAFQDVMTR